MYYLRCNLQVAPSRYYYMVAILSGVFALRERSYGDEKSDHVTIACVPNIPDINGEIKLPVRHL